MSPLFFIFSFFLSLSLERQIGLVAKRMQRPLNVYYRDYSAHLPIEERDKLMKMKLDDEGNENLQDDIEGAIDINKMHAQESELGALLKGQMELSRQIREDLRGRTRKNKQMSVKYNHGDSDAVDGYWTGENKDAEHFDVDTEIEVPTDSMREPVVLVKIPAVDIYDQMEVRLYTDTFLAVVHKGRLAAIYYNHLGFPCALFFVDVTRRWAFDGYKE